MSKTKALVTRQKKRTANAPRGGSNPPNQMVHKVCGLSDPFCEHALGAKYPDDSNVRTLTLPFHARASVSTGATSQAGLIVCPQYGQPSVFTATGFTGNVATSWSAAGGYPAPAITGVQKYRIVTCGMRIRRVSAPLYASGMVYIRAWPNEVPDGFTNLDLGSYNATQSMDVAFQDCNDVAVIFPHSSQMPQAFYDLPAGTAITDWSANGFCPVSIYVNAAPASTVVLDIEFFFNYEVIFTDDTATAILATPAPAYSPVLSGATARVTSKLSSMFLGGVKAAGRAITNGAIQALGTYFGGPAGGRAAGRLTNYVITDVD